MIVLLILYSPANITLASEPATNSSASPTTVCPIPVRWWLKPRTIPVINVKTPGIAAQAMIISSVITGSMIADGTNVVKVSMLTAIPAATPPTKVR